jgi:hypothetical protein
MPEANIGNRAIGENTEVKTNLKTVFWIASGLFVIMSFLFTTFYFDMRDKIKDTNSKMDAVIEEMQNEVDAKVKKDLESFLERQIEIKDDIGEMKGDIKVILDRTSGNQDNSGHTIFEPDYSPPTSAAPPAESVPEEVPVPIEDEEPNPQP